MFLAHTHVTICRSISTLDPVGNDSATVHYDFENPIYRAEDGSEEDCEVPEELARLLLQEERTIQPHEESIETVDLSTKSRQERSQKPLGALELHCPVYILLDCYLQTYLQITEDSQEMMNVRKLLIKSRSVSKNLQF